MAGGTTLGLGDRGGNLVACMDQAVGAGRAPSRNQFADGHRMPPVVVQRDSYYMEPSIAEGRKDDRAAVPRMDSHQHGSGDNVKAEHGE